MGGVNHVPDGPRLSQPDESSFTGLGPPDDPIPEWLAKLAPNLPREAVVQAAEAWARCAEDLRRRTRLFVRRAICGVPCRHIDPKTGCWMPARYIFDEAVTTIFIEEIVIPGKFQVAQQCCLKNVQNIWIRADSDLVRRVHGALCFDLVDTELDFAVLIDAPTGLIGLVERSLDAREEFLDCMAVLIATRRLDSEPELTHQCLPGGPPMPEAELRLKGHSLRSMHLHGPICAWLAKAGEDLPPPQPPPNGSDEGRVNLESTASSDEASPVTSSTTVSSTRESACKWESPSTITDVDSHGSVGEG